MTVKPNLRLALGIWNLKKSIWLQNCIQSAMNWINLPSHFPGVILVSLVHESIPWHTKKKQSSQFTSAPSKTLPRDDFPTPVAPKITILGLGRGPLGSETAKKKTWT